MVALARRELNNAQWMRGLQKILSHKGVKGLAGPCSGYFFAQRRHLVGGIVVLCFFTIFAVSTIKVTSRKIGELVPKGELPEYERWQKIVDDGNGAIMTSNKFGTCTIDPPEHLRPPVDPILAPSFPGAAPDLTRYLVESTTGLWTSSRKFRDDVVAIKTHHPYHSHHVSVEDCREKQPKAVILLRDPLDTMISWHNWIYNTKHELKNNNQAPIESWIEWRDMHFEKEMNQWNIFFRYWLDHVPKESRLILHYENLLDEASGPSEAIEMAEFIKTTGIATKMVPFDSIPCIWFQIVNFQGSENGSFMLDNNSDRPLTYGQLDVVAGTLTELISEYRLDSKTLQMMLKYKARVLEKMQQLQNVDPILVTNALGSCMVTIPTLRDLTPIFQASYPGSGSELLRDLTEAITGIKTGEGKRLKKVITIKTHYPTIAHHLAPGFWNNDMNRAILLVRNPLYAITSSFNHVYERENNALPHSTQAPMNEWVTWRDKNFSRELDLWAKHYSYWMSTFSPNNLLVLMFEAIVDDKRGPIESARIAEFLSENGYNENIRPAPTSTIPCLWFRAVKVNNREKLSQSSNNKINTYTLHQLETTATLLNNLSIKYENRPEIGKILRDYWEDAISRLELVSSPS